MAWYKDGLSKEVQVYLSETETGKTSNKFICFSMYSRDELLCTVRSLVMVRNLVASATEIIQNEYVYLSFAMLRARRPIF